MAKWMMLMLCGLVSFNMMSLSTGAQCGDIIDIGLMIDASASMGEEWLVSAIAFAIQLTKNFTISYSETRFALISFSNEAISEFYFKDYTNDGEIKLALEKVDFMNSSTRIDKALELARNEIFTQAAGSRSSASRFLVIATDGRFPENGLPTFHSLLLPLKQLNIEVFVVGIGTEVLMSELNALAINKSENVFPSPTDLHRDKMVERIRSIANDKCGSLPI